LSQRKFNEIKEEEEKVRVTDEGYDEEHEAPKYGILHTLEQYGEWADKEEKLVNLIETRLEILKKEEELMTR